MRGKLVATALVGAVLSLGGAGTAVAAPAAWLSEGYFEVYDHCAGVGRGYVENGWYKTYICVPSNVYDSLPWELLVLV